MGLGGVMGRIVELLNGKKNGFFIECGAFDGRFIVGIFERLHPSQLNQTFITIALLFQVRDGAILWS